MLGKVLAAVVLVLPLVASLVFAFMPEKKEQPIMHRKWRLAFVIAAVAYTAIVFWQQWVVDKEADKQRQELVGKIDAAQGKLDKAQDSLNTSLLAQERMRGQMEGLALILGKLNDTNSGGVRQLVGALNKMANTESVHTLTNKQLCDRTKDLVKNMREFAANIRTRSNNMLDSQRAAMAAVSTQEEKNKVFNDYSNNLISQLANTEIEFKSKYLGEAVYLRDEMTKRLPSLPPSHNRILWMFEGHLNGSDLLIVEGSDYLEQLAKRLCPE